MGVTIVYSVYTVYADTAGVVFLIYSLLRDVLDTYPEDAPAFLQSTTITDGQPEHAIWV